MRNLLPLVFIALPTLAFADPRLERMEDISERLMDTMIEAFAEMKEAEGASGDSMRAVAPKMHWNDDMRTAASCALGRYIAASSPAAVDKMLDDIEAMIPQIAENAMDAFENPPEMLPEGMTEADSQAISEECGMLDVQIKIMQESGFMAAMMDG